MSPARLKLKELEETGGFVFHGSGEDLDVLEPEQARNVKEGKSVNDGPPAIFASTAADYAVFMAVFSKKNCPLGRHTKISSWSYKDGTYTLKFQATENTLSQIDARSKGYVYVFRKSDFYEREPGGIEFTNRRPAQPLQRFEVTRDDILGDVDVM